MGVSVVLPQGERGGLTHLFLRHARRYPLPERTTRSFVQSRTNVCLWQQQFISTVLHIARRHGDDGGLGLIVAYYS